MGMILLGLLQIAAIGAMPATGAELDQMPAGYNLQFYDDCGVAGRQPHVPAQVGHVFSPGQVEGDAQARSVTYGVPDFVATYEGLKENTPYAVAVTYASEKGNPRVQRLSAGSAILHGPLTLPDGRAQRFIYAVPPGATAQGKLTLEFHCESGHNAVASVIELWAPLPTRDALHLELTPYVTGMLCGGVENAAYAPFAGAKISIQNEVTGAGIETQTGADGKFSVDVSAQVAAAKEGSFRVSSSHAGMQAEATVGFEALRFEEPVIRPIPSRVAGIRQAQLVLDGTWKIWPITQEKPGGKVEPPQNARDFIVPGQWLQQGFDFPRGSEVGLAREFTVPKQWAGQRLFLRFDAVHGGARYWLNGKELGYSENLFTPIEFDVTDAAHLDGKNTLAMTVKVDTPSELASFSSNYAFHNLGGIDRSVRLFALPAVHLTDLCWTTDFDDAYRNAMLSLRMNIENTLKESALGVVCNIDVRELHGGRRIAYQEQPLEALPSGSCRQEVMLDVREPRKWSDEAPNLYALSVELRKDGRLLERIEQRIGFREVETNSGKLLVNGRPVKLAGVNRHETDPLTGRAATACHGKEDAQLFKNANFNYIRTSHYPPTSEFLDACDELGLYVECEAPFCWARGGHGEDDSALGKVFLAPAAAMVRAHRNHPSIILWSIANESGNGPDAPNELPENFQLTMEYCRRTDPSRLVLFNNEWARDGGRGDIAVLHYPGWPPEGSEWIKSDPRPVLLDEYFPPQTFMFPDTLKRNPGLDVVNWSGGQNRANSFWEHLYRSKNVIGGAIWAGIDEEFLLPGGKTAGYGPWGFFDGWRRPKSLWWDAKLIFGPVHIPVRRVDWKPEQAIIEIPIENRYTFTNLNELKIAWEVNGKHGNCRMDLPPAQEGRLALKLPRGVREGDLLALRFFDAHRNLVTAHGVRLGHGNIPAPPVPSAGCPEWTDDGTTIAVNAKEFSFRIDKSSLEITGNTALRAFPRIFLTRFEERNVFSPNGLPYLEIPDATTRTIKGFRVTPSATFLSLVVEDAYAGYEGAVELRIDSAGQCQVVFDYGYMGETLNLGELGVQFLLGGQCDTIDWQRKAEWDVLPEDHIGRASGRAYARNGNPVDAATGRPQGPWHLDANEFGTRDFRATKYNIYEACIHARDGRGLRVDSDGSADVRACLSGNDVAVHVLQSEERGEKTLPWPLGPAPRQLKPGGRIMGQFSVRLL